MATQSNVIRPLRRVFQRAATLPPIARFALGILRHPAEARIRLRELGRIVTAPPVKRSMRPHGPPPEVKIIPVTELDSTGRLLVDIYARNPSPFVSGPTSLEQLEASLQAGVRYFLICNDAGVPVGTRGFDPRSKRLLSAVTDFPYRRRGYHLAAAAKVRELLAREGHREFRSAVLRSNTRMQRAMATAGWRLAPDPENPDLLRGTLFVQPHPDSQ